MSALRKQARVVSVLVIALMLTSPFARAFCQLLVNPAEAAIALAAVNCSAAKRTQATNEALPPGRHSPSKTCDVCLALASVDVPPPVLETVLGGWRFVERVEVADTLTVPVQSLQLGGIGSRAPPLGT